MKENGDDVELEGSVGVEHQVEYVDADDLVAQTDWTPDLIVFQSLERPCREVVSSPPVVQRDRALMHDSGCTEHTLWRLIFIGNK